MHIITSSHKVEELIQDRGGGKKGAGLMSAEYERKNILKRG